MKRTLSTTKISKLMILIFCFAFLFTGCGGGGDNSTGSTSINQGHFFDSAVEGLNYLSGEEFGITDSQGTFTFQLGSTIKFSIGDIIIGEALAKSTMTPVDLVQGATDEFNPTVTAIARFLQTLDDDANPNNGITIIANVGNFAVGKFINFEQTIAAFENDLNVQTLVSELTAYTNAGVRTLISSNEAQSHLGDTLLELTQKILLGTWEINNIEGIPDFVGGPSGVDSSNSTWIFKEDGTYEWFFYFDRDPYYFDVSSQGAYSLKGNILYAEGMSDIEVTYSDTIILTFSNNENIFSFVDDEDDRWTYTKIK